MGFIILIVAFLVITTMVLVGLSLMFSNKSVKSYSLKELVKNKKKK
jgi:flagellar basal body-associated protein FliL